MPISLIPRNYLFYDLFEESARKLVTAARTLTDLMEHFENVEMKTLRMKDLEHEADEITHRLYRLLNSTFVTPLR